MNELKNIDAMDTFEVYIRTSVLELNILSNDIIDLWFIEDIYSLCMKGRLSFVDKDGLMEFGGISGTETIEIVYGQEDNKKSISFHVHNTKSILINKTDYRIEMDLIDESFKDLNYHTYSSSYTSNSLYTDIVKDLASKYFKILEYQLFEDCIEKLPYFDTDNSTPADNIKWLLKRCSGTKSGQPGYLMYQNTSEKRWNLTTLEYLLQQKKKMWITSKEEMYVFDDVNINYINKIQSHKIKGVSNKVVPDISRGYLLGYDPMTKIFNHRTYSYIDAIDKYTILGMHTLFESTQILPYLQSEATPINTGESDLKIMDNMWFGDWIKKYCLQQLIEINVKGHEDRYAGGMIEVVWKSKNVTGEKLNQSLNGKYLIKSITHHLSHSRTPKYQQSIVLIKNGFGERQEGTFIKAKKVNI
jgi:hypothetical protein